VRHRESPAAACFRLVNEGRLTLHLSPDWVKTFVDTAVRQASMLSNVPHVFSYPRDPDDEPHVDLAVAVGATYLVSRDTNLLELMDDPDFRARFPSLTILDPVALLRVMQ
jgi:predicted nucleic acid-binding protein